MNDYGKTGDNFNSGVENLEVTAIMVIMEEPALVDTKEALFFCSRHKFCHGGGGHAMVDDAM